MDASSSQNSSPSVGPYRIVRRLGQGGMGEVYEGYDARLERRVALKRIRPGAASSAMRRRFRREARAIARLRHPAIVQIYDWVAADDGDWIVMELVEGRALDQLLRAGPLAPARAARLARGILAGLAAAHAAGIVHRDLKAGNVMVTAAGDAPEPGAADGGEQVRILDFGLARLFEPDDSTAASADGKLLGTLSALSPEQVTDHPVDHRSDLFSLGTLLYQLTTGALPFHDASPAVTLQRIATFQPPPASRRRPEVPLALSAFIDHLLEKDPRRRPANAVAALAELDQALAEIETPATAELSGAPIEDSVFGRETRLTREAPPRADRRRIALAAGAGAVLLLAAVGLLLRPPPETLYVAVPETELHREGEDPAADLELMAGAVRTALLRGLLGFEGVAPLEATASDGDAADPAALVTALAAGEVLGSRLECGSSGCQVVLRRLGPEGRLLWTHSFAVVADELLELSLAIFEHLRGGYPQHRLRAGVPDLEVRAQDYAAYLRLRQRYLLREDAASLEEVMAELGKLQHGSPRFLAPSLLVAMVAGQRFQETRSAADLERAEAAVAWARKLAPDDPRVLWQQARIARIGGREEEAAAALESLLRRDPGNARWRVEHAFALERLGRGDQALERMRQAVAGQPSWRHLARLADMEMRQGRIDAARRHLEAALDRVPEHYDLRSRLAQFELLNGRPQRAAELYALLVERSPGFAELTNLGVAELLLERYDAAEQSFHRALERAPRSPFALLNLADARWLAGSEDEARELYRRTLERIAEDPDPAALRTVRAQALAHLARGEEAVAEIQEALRLAPENPQTLYEAALVYVLVGDEASALWNARQALERGVEPVWFAFPWFAPLRERLPLAQPADPERR